MGSHSGLILGLRPTNERRRYKVTPSLIGWAQTWNQPWHCLHCLVVIASWRVTSLIIRETRLTQKITLHQSIDHFYEAVLRWHHMSVAWRIKSPAVRLFGQQFVEANSNESSRALDFYEGVRLGWIPLTKGQYCGKYLREALAGIARWVGKDW